MHFGFVFMSVSNLNKRRWFIGVDLGKVSNLARSFVAVRSLTDLVDD
jgi:hypothetical protein